MGKKKPTTSGDDLADQSNESKADNSTLLNDLILAQLAFGDQFNENRADNSTLLDELTLAQLAFGDQSNESRADNSTLYNDLTLAQRPFGDQSNESSAINSTFLDELTLAQRSFEENFLSNSSLAISTENELRKAFSDFDSRNKNQSKFVTATQIPLSRVEGISERQQSSSDLLETISESTIFENPRASSSRDSSTMRPGISASSSILGTRPSNWDIQSQTKSSYKPPDASTGAIPKRRPSNAATRTPIESLYEGHYASNSERPSGGHSARNSEGNNESKPETHHAKNKISQPEDHYAGNTGNQPEGFYRGNIESQLARQMKESTSKLNSSTNDMRKAQAMLSDLIFEVGGRNLIPTSSNKDRGEKPKLSRQKKLSKRFDKGRRLLQKKDDKFYHAAESQDEGNLLKSDSENNALQNDCILQDGNAQISGSQDEGNLLISDSENNALQNDWILQDENAQISSDFQNVRYNSRGVVPLPRESIATNSAASENIPLLKQTDCSTSSEQKKKKTFSNSLMNAFKPLRFSRVTTVVKENPPTYIPSPTKEPPPTYEEPPTYESALNVPTIGAREAVTNIQEAEDPPKYEESSIPDNAFNDSSDSD